MNGTVRDGRISWRAQDVEVIVGDPGNDNEGIIQSDEIPMSYSDPRTGERGTYTLVLKRHASARTDAKTTPGAR